MNSNPYNAPVVEAPTVPKSIFWGRMFWVSLFYTVIGVGFSIGLMSNFFRGLSDYSYGPLGVLRLLEVGWTGIVLFGVSGVTSCIICLSMKRKVRRMLEQQVQRL